MYQVEAIRFHIFETDLRFHNNSESLLKCRAFNAGEIYTMESLCCKVWDNNDYDKITKVSVICVLQWLLDGLNSGHIRLLYELKNYH